jgi:hypothetical protein
VSGIPSFFYRPRRRTSTLIPPRRATPLIIAKYEIPGNLVQIERPTVARMIGFFFLPPLGFARIQTPSRFLEHTTRML